MPRQTPECCIGDDRIGKSMSELTACREYMRQTVLDEAERNPQWAARCLGTHRELCRLVDEAAWLNSEMEASHV